VGLDSNLMTQKAGAATVIADYSQAQRQADTDKALYELGVISGLAYKSSKGKADELTTRNDLEGQRLAINRQAIETQLAQERAKVDRMCQRKHTVDRCGGGYDIAGALRPRL
jgi:hypothetical protein